MFIEVVLLEISVEAFNVSILRWLARLNQHFRDAVPISPLIERSAGKLRSMIREPRNVNTRQAVRWFHQNKLLGEVIHHRPDLRLWPLVSEAMIHDMDFPAKTTKCFNTVTSVP